MSAVRFMFHNNKELNHKFSLKLQPNLVELASLIKMYVDYRLKDQSPLKLIALSAGAAYSFAWLQKFITDEVLCKNCII